MKFEFSNLRPRSSTSRWWSARSSRRTGSHRWKCAGRSWFLSTRSAVPWAPLASARICDDTSGQPHSSSVKKKLFESEIDLISRPHLRCRVRIDLHSRRKCCWLLCWRTSRAAYRWSATRWDATCSTRLSTEPPRCRLSWSFRWFLSCPTRRHGTCCCRRWILWCTGTLSCRSRLQASEGPGGVIFL